MSRSQRKIGSGFSPWSIPEEVLHGIDLSGELAIVTGGYSGIGLEVTRALARAGAHVVVPARRVRTAQRALAGIDGTEVAELDLGDLGSVRGFAERFLATGRTIGIVITCAGIMSGSETRVGPGWEAQFATNHLGHYALVNLLWPAIAAGQGRVVSVSSGAHRRSAIRWDDVHFERGFDKWQAYGQSKTANALFAVHLDTLAKDAGVRAYSLHPGAVITPLWRRLPRQEMVAMGWIDERGNLIEPTFKTAEQAAATMLWVATSPLLNEIGGVYCEDCDLSELTTDPIPLSGVRPHAIDPGQAARLWTLSAELTGLDAFDAEA